MRDTSTTPLGPPPAPRRAGEVRAMFSRIAPTYDRLNRLLSFSVDRRWRRRAAQRALGPRAPQQERRVLDVCCGTGDLAIGLARGPASERDCVVGLDFSHEMLVGAAAKGRTLDRPGAASPSWAQADALRLPFPDGCFDAASMAFGLRNLVDATRGIAEMARVVRAGGVVVVLEFSMPRAWWLRPLYRFYLGRVLPAVGNALSRSRAYGYLARTVRDFAEPEEVCRWMDRAGLGEPKAEPLTGGIAHLYWGTAQ